MSSAKLTSKGQITIPVDVRRALGVGAGDRIEFVRSQPDRFELIPATRSIRGLRGLFGQTKQTISVPEMNAAVARRTASVHRKRAR